jgi:hypothetical protein
MHAWPSICMGHILLSTMQVLQGCNLSFVVCQMMAGVQHQLPKALRFQ